jgi:hypothetical protein
MAKKTQHECDRSDVDWKPLSHVSGIGGKILSWPGVCRVCKREVEERYYADDHLTDSKTREAI